MTVLMSILCQELQHVIYNVSVTHSIFERKVNHILFPALYETEHFFLFAASSHFINWTLNPKSDCSHSHLN